jgi:beta-1,4-mannosyltransferase
MESKPIAAGGTGGATSAPFRVMQISRVRMNPYVGLMQRALQGEGIECTTADALSPRLVQSWHGSVDIVHVHWLELLYASPRPASSLRQWAAVMAGLAWSRAARLTLVCTMHNLNPHEGTLPRLDHAAYRVLLSLASAVHVHDDMAREDLARMYGRRTRVYVVPHGSYIGAYPNDCTRQQARERWGLKPEAFVYLFLGQLRRYKGVEDLVTAFRSMADEGSRLMIAGNAHDPTYAQELARLTRGDPRIVTWFQYVTDAEVEYFMNACDVCVLPYRDVTTSGAAVLALSFGRPIIAPSLGAFSELAADGRGILYGTSEDGLLSALNKARQADTGRAGQQALAWAEQHAWSRLAPAFVRMYSDALGA